MPSLRFKFGSDRLVYPEFRFGSNRLVLYFPKLLLLKIALFSHFQSLSCIVLYLPSFPTCFANNILAENKKKGKIDTNLKCRTED